MKQLTTLICLILLVFTANAQIELGIKGGIHSYNLSEIAGLQYKEGDFAIVFEPAAAKYGFQFGGYGRLHLLGLFLESSVLLNSSKFTYNIRDNNVADELYDESFLNLDLPVLLGVSILPFLKAKAGPVGHVHLDSSSDLIAINGYSQTFSRLKYGYLLGLGVDLFKLRAELLYEGNFSKFGDHITIDGSQFAFDKSASRFILNIGLAF